MYVCMSMCILHNTYMEREREKKDQANVAECHLRNPSGLGEAIQDLLILLLQVFDETDVMILKLPLS